MNNLFFVVAVGRDCDGCYPSNTCIGTFHSKTVAERLQENANMASDGILYVAVDKKTFDENFRDERKQDIYYMPFIGSPYFVGNNK